MIGFLSVAGSIGCAMRAVMWTATQNIPFTAVVSALIFLVVYLFCYNIKLRDDIRFLKKDRSVSGLVLKQISINHN